MRTLTRRLMLAGTAVGLASSGCTWLEKVNPFSSDRRTPTGPITERPAEHYANFLNRQAAVLDGLSYEDVSVTVGMGGLIDPDLSAQIDCAKPRSFRMKANHGLQSGQLDVGSNDQRFWMYVRHGNPKYVFTSHDDLATGRANLPVPFDPDWVFMALGMSGVTATNTPTVEHDPKNRESVLSYLARTPQGQTVKKLVGFSADEQTGTNPQVKWYAVANPRTKDPIATATVRKVKRVQVNDPRTGQPEWVSIPTDVKLAFTGPDNQKLKLDLTLRRERINPAFTPEQTTHLFGMPATLHGATPVNLANNAGWPQGTPNARGQAPTRR